MHDNVRTIQRALQFFRYTFCDMGGYNPPTIFFVHVFRNESFLDHIRPHSTAVIERLLPALYRKGRLFWNLTVNKMTAAVLKKFSEMDGESFESIANEVAGGSLPSKRALSTEKGMVNNILTLILLFLRIYISQ